MLFALGGSRDALCKNGVHKVYRSPCIIRSAENERPETNLDLWSPVKQSLCAVSVISHLDSWHSEGILLCMLYLKDNMTTPHPSPTSVWDYCILWCFGIWERRYYMEEKAKTSTLPWMLSHNSWLCTLKGLILLYYCGGLVVIIKPISDLYGDLYTIHHQPLG